MTSLLMLQVVAYHCMLQKLHPRWVFLTTPSDHDDKACGTRVAFHYLASWLINSRNTRYHCNVGE
jgi:hypothetical protein